MWSNLQSYLAEKMIQDYKPEFKLKKGDPAPPIHSVIQDDSLFDLYAIKSKWIVLFFYPEDNTPTCTKEACNIRDNYDDLKAMGISIFGISPDSETRHQHFISKFDLPYDLIVDKDHHIASDYGVWGTKKFMGIIFDGIHRSTFIINQEHNIHEIIYPVVSATHHEQILNSVKNEK